MTLTFDRMKDAVSYDPGTGAFAWIKPTSNRVHRGRNAVPNGRGRVTIRIDGRTYPAPRVAWLYMTGEWPRGVVDHVNGDTTDNRWANLRDVPQATNTQNIRKPHRDNKVGMQGVVLRSSGKYAANIYINGRQTCLGRFETPDEAHAAYVAAKREAHAGCTI